MRRGYSHEAISANISALLREGKSKQQAVAISLKCARDDYFKRFPDGALPLHLSPTGGNRLNPKRRPNPVPPSTRSTHGTVEQQIKKARLLYENFTGHDADEVVEVDKPPFPDVLSVIGDIDGVLYTTVRDGKTESYIHKFKKNSRPLFCVSPDGLSLHMLGGSYEFGERGIEDK